MSDWRPSSGPATAMVRARMLTATRTFFDQRNVLEISTPVLSRTAVSDPHIESVTARLNVEPLNDYYLRTSPEFCMKRLLSAGYPDIYEIGRVFRDGEAGYRHQPEFTMVEWYRLDFGLDEIIDDTVAYIHAVLSPDRLAYDAERVSYRDAFLEYAAVDPLHDDIQSLIAACNVDPELADSLGEDRNDWLNLLLTQKVAPEFAKDRLTVLYHYPASQAALAQICAHDNAVADRFEVYLADLELGNGYVELTDAAEQRARCAADLAVREAKHLPVVPLDEEFLAALDNGMPACAGVAVGFERLLMLEQNSDDIRDVMTFAYRRAT